jgi:chaperonin GroES
MTQKPLGDRVVLREIEAKEEVIRNIIIPDSAKTDDTKHAIVEAVGPGIYTQSGVLIPMSVAVGDEVIIPPYHQGTEIKVDGQKYILLRESDILMIV